MKKTRKRIAIRENKNPGYYKANFYRYYSEFLYSIDGLDVTDSNLGVDVSREVITIGRQGKLTGICC